MDALNRPVRLAYTVFEPSGDADESLHPVLFLHGLMLSKEDWGNIPQIIADETRRKVYVLDARNHGDSEWSDFFTQDQFVADLLHFMKVASVPKAVLIGHSLGGKTSLMAALKEPERFETLIVEDMHVGSPEGQGQSGLASYLMALQEAIRHVPSGADDAMASALIWKYIRKHMPERPKNLEFEGIIPLKRDQNGELRYKTNIKVLTEVLSKMSGNPSPPSGVYNGPAYFLYGQESPMGVWKRKDMIEQLFPKAVLIGVEKAGHVIHREMPEKFTKMVLDILRKK